ncbi:glutathione S-transferase family protein [soil metagenome]
MSITLYYHPLSSYCHKVLTALYEANTPFGKTIVNLGDPQERAALQARWPFGKFPVVHDSERDHNVAESSIIIEYLDRFHRGDVLMIPLDPENALEVRYWDRFFDLYVHTPMQAIVADRIGGGKGDMAPQRAMLDTAYGMIDTHMQGRAWASTSGFTLADCAAAPALFYARAVHPVPERAGNLKAYFERLIARPSYAQVLQDAKPFFQYFPFQDKLEPRFV